MTVNHKYPALVSS